MKLQCLPGLSVRQTQVAILTAQGFDYPLIAKTLGISRNSAIHHREIIYRKLNIHGIALLCRWVYEQQTLAAILHNTQYSVDAFNTPQLAKSA